MQSCPPVRLIVVATLGFLGCMGPAGGAVSGAADTHCIAADGGAIAQDTSAAACHVADANAPMPEYGETRYNAQSADDDCKYDVQLTVTPVRQAESVTLVVKVTARSDGAPVTGATAHAEIFLNDTHPAPNAGTSTVEAPAGTYTIGPVKFDASGRWTARFHFFESCADDSEESPHGHVGFFLDVP
jgi:hypothetical protein